MVRIKHAPHVEVTMADNEDDVKPWVLYVARHKGDFCKGSALCLRLIENLGIDDMIVIQDCNALHSRGVEFPDWLTGSPTLVHRDSFTRFTGSDAVAQLSSLGGEATSSIESSSKHTLSDTEHMPDVTSARQQRFVDDDEHRSQQESKLAAMMQARQYGAMSGVGDMPHRTQDDRMASSRPPHDPFHDNDDSEDHNSGSLGIEDILKSPPTDAPMESKRVTENDVNRFMEERKRFDDMQKQRMNGGPQQQR